MSGALAGIITRGLLSARPAYVSPADAAKGGALHFATDTGDLWRWSGAAWELVGNYLALGVTATTAAAGNDSRLSDPRVPSGGAGGVLSGNYPNPGFAVDMATQAELDAVDTARAAALTAHTGAATGAHAASAVAFTPNGNIAATTVQAAIVEVRDEIPTGASGPAGGVLLGSYPNPGFAVDMATQAELDAAIAARTAALDAHTSAATGAHAASAIAFTPNGSIAASTVQAAIQEVRDEATGLPAGGTVGQTIVNTAPGVGAWGAPIQLATLNFVIDGSGAAITTGLKGFLELPFTGAILRATLLADQAGSIVVDLWRATYANYPPVVANTITASAKPTISAATKAQNTTLTGWATAFTAGDVLAVNVDSATTVQRVTLSLLIQRTA